MWVAKKFGSCASKVQKWEGEVINLELKEEVELLTHEELNQKHTSEIKLEEALHDQDTFCLQRMNNLWKLQGDKCSCMFHKS